MTRINLTLSNENLHQLISGDDQGMSTLLKEVLDQVLEHQRTEQVEANHYERTGDRKGYRNGYKPYYPGWQNYPKDSPNPGGNFFNGALPALPAQWTGPCAHSNGNGG